MRSDWSFNPQTRDHLFIIWEERPACRFIQGQEENEPTERTRGNWSCSVNGNPGASCLCSTKPQLFTKPGTLLLHFGWSACHPKRKHIPSSFAFPYQYPRQTSFRRTDPLESHNDLSLFCLYSNTGGGKAKNSKALGGWTPCKYRTGKFKAIYPFILD